MGMVTEAGSEAEVPLELNGVWERLGASEDVALVGFGGGPRGVVLAMEEAREVFWGKLTGTNVDVVEILRRFGGGERFGFAGDAEREGSMLFMGEVERLVMVPLDGA